jgi:hypothetical protein
MGTKIVYFDGNLENISLVQPDVELAYHDFG